jgi:hypothetical protein
MEYVAREPSVVIALVVALVRIVRSRHRVGFAVASADPWLSSRAGARRELSSISFHAMAIIRSSADVYSPRSRTPMSSGECTESPKANAAPAAVEGNGIEVALVGETVGSSLRPAGRMRATSSSSEVEVLTVKGSSGRREDAAARLKNRNSWYGRSE